MCSPSPVAPGDCNRQLYTYCVHFSLLHFAFFLYMSSCISYIPWTLMPSFLIFVLREPGGTELGLDYKLKCRWPLTQDYFRGDSSLRTILEVMAWGSGGHTETPLHCVDMWFTPCVRTLHGERKEPPLSRCPLTRACTGVFHKIMGPGSHCHNLRLQQEKETFWGE